MKFSFSKSWLKIDCVLLSKLQCNNQAFILEKLPRNFSELFFYVFSKYQSFLWVFFFLQLWIFANSASVCLWGENVNTPTVCRCFLALINPKKDSQIEDGRSDQQSCLYPPTFIERNESAMMKGSLN